MAQQGQEINAKQAQEATENQETQEVATQAQVDTQAQMDTDTQVDTQAQEATEDQETQEVATQAQVDTDAQVDTQAQESKSNGKRKKKPILIACQAFEYIGDEPFRFKDTLGYTHILEPKAVFIVPCGSLSRHFKAKKTIFKEL